MYRKIDIPFQTPREADVVYQVLRVDAEPKRSGVKKVMHVEDNVLKVTFSANEARKIRVGVTSFFESIILVTETTKIFGPPKEKYSHYN